MVRPGAPGIHAKVFLSAAILIHNAAGSDTVLVNGRIFTGIRGVWVEALSISDGRVQAVGKSMSIRAQASKGARVIDLGGRLVVPGFNDAHVHFGPLNGTR